MAGTGRIICRVRAAWHGFVDRPHTNPTGRRMSAAIIGHCGGRGIGGLVRKTQQRLAWINPCGQLDHNRYEAHVLRQLDLVVGQRWLAVECHVFIQIESIEKIGHVITVRIIGIHDQAFASVTTLILQTLFLGGTLGQLELIRVVGIDIEIHTHDGNIHGIFERRIHSGGRVAGDNLAIHWIHPFDRQW